MSLKDDFFQDDAMIREEEGRIRQEEKKRPEAQAPREEAGDKPDKTPQKSAARLAGMDQPTRFTKINSESEKAPKSRHSAKSKNSSKELEKSKARSEQEEKHPLRPWQETFRGFLLFPLAIIYMEALLRLLNHVPFWTNLGYPLFFGLAGGWMLAGVCELFKRKTRRKLSIVLLSILTVVYILQCLINRSYEVYMSISDILHGAEGVTTGYTNVFLRVILYSIPIMILFAVPLVCYILLSSPKRKVNHRKETAATMKDRRLRGAGALVLGLILMIAAAAAAQNGAMKSRYGAHFAFNSATRTFGLLTSTRLDIQYMIFGKPHEGLDINTGESSSAELPPSQSGSESTVPQSSSGAPSSGESASSDPSSQSSQESSQESIPEPIVYGKNELDLDYVGLAERTGNEYIEEVAAYVTSQTPASQNAYTGLFEGKNIIMICAEAWSDACVTKELMPTTYRLLHEGIYFSDYYQPAWGGSTITGEFSFLLGLAPQNAIDSMMDTKYNNNYFTLPMRLRDKGYTSVAFHNGSYDYYDRDQTHENLGFDDWIAQGNGLEELTYDWPDDEHLLHAMLENYANEPFVLYCMSVSGHAPYNDSQDIRVLEHLDTVRERMGASFDDYYEHTINYICYQMELEDALTYTVNTLEEKGILDDTVIVMTTDHYPYGLARSESWGNSEDCIEDLYKHPHSNNWDRDESGLIIWSGCLEHEHKDLACEVSTPVSSLDILPTLLNLFGIRYDSRLLVGRDVFSDQEPLVFWTDTSWVTEIGKFDADLGTITLNPGKTLPDEGYVERINRLVSNRLTISRRIVYNDYYGTLADSIDTLLRLEEEAKAREEASQNSGPGGESQEGAMQGDPGSSTQDPSQDPSSHTSSNSSSDSGSTGE